jgi:hypothetical protein
VARTLAHLLVFLVLLVCIAFALAPRAVAHEEDVPSSFASGT